MILKTIIKVPLLLAENIFFGLLPKTRPFIEKYIFNPYFFGGDHNNYSLNQFETFKTKLNNRSNLKNKKILELGPGGSIGFGLLTLKEGASKYYAIDSNLHYFVSKEQKNNYAKLINSKKLINQYLQKNSKGYTYNKNKIEFLEIDQSSRYQIANNSIDLIYSCAVLEHVHNLDLCFEEMCRVLKPEGIMYHQVDLRDHIFSQKNLLFLKINKSIYELLFKNCGAYTNRKRFNYYLQLIEKNNLKIIGIDKNLEKPRKRTGEDGETLSFNFILKNRIK